VRTVRVIAAAFIVWALALGYSVRALPTSSAGVPRASPVQAPAGTEPTPPNTECLECHDDDAAVRENGTPIVVKGAVFAASIHADVACVDCHEDLAKAEMPHAEKLAKVNCATCHDEAAGLFKRSAHARARANGSAVAASCVDCHGTHETKPKTDPQSPTHHLEIARTCAKCHGNTEIIRKGGMPAGVTEAFADSIHGRVLAKSGLVVAPTCSSCHGAHDIIDPDDPASPVAASNVVSTCGTCHEGIARQFEGSVHAAVTRAGHAGAPACQTCHTAHGIQRAENAAWQLSVINQCGSCHNDRIATFRDTFHGQVTTLGSRSVAGCADCHGAHEVRPASDPRSPVAPANLVKTCSACHKDADASFVKYDPHANKHDRQRNPGLFYASKFMTILLGSVFAFFGIHSALWMGKEIHVKRARAARQPGRERE
jgi:hypothetical protein